MKALVGGACQLSLPAVTEGREYTLSIPGSTVVNAVEFGCHAQPLQVTVLERQVG